MTPPTRAPAVDPTWSGGRPLPAARVVAALALLTLAAGALTLAGRAAPFPSPSASGVLTWADRHHPAVVAVALVRGAALLAVVHLAVAVIALAVGAGRAGPTRRLLPRRTLRVAAMLLGTSVAPLPALAAPGVEPGPGSTAVTAPPPAVLHVVDAPPTAVVPILHTPGPSATPGAPPPATLIRVGPTTAPPDTAAPHAVPHEVPEPHAPVTVEVRPGDHCWGIAAREVAARLGDGTDPTDEQVWPYFHALLRANADRFVVPGEPDLILPGQQLVLPAWPA